MPSHLGRVSKKESVIFILYYKEIQLFPENTRQLTLRTLVTLTHNTEVTLSKLRVFVDSSIDTVDTRDRTTQRRADMGGVRGTECDRGANDDMRV